MYTHHHAWLQFAALTLTLANSLNEPNKSGKYFYVFYTWFTFILIGHLTLLKVLKYTLAIALSTCLCSCWQWTSANEEGRSLSFVVIPLNSNPIGGERVMCRGSKLPKANKTHLKKKKKLNFRLARYQVMLLETRQICEPAGVKQTISSQFCSILSWEIQHCSLREHWGSRGNKTHCVKFIWNNSYMNCGCGWKWRMIIAVNFPI